MNDLLRAQRARDKRQVDLALKELMELIDVDELRRRRARRLAIQAVLRREADNENYNQERQS